MDGRRHVRRAHPPGAARHRRESAQTQRRDTRPAHRAGGADRAARRGRADKSGDRRAALPQPAHVGWAPAQGIHEARRRLPHAAARQAARRRTRWRTGLATGTADQASDQGFLGRDGAARRASWGHTSSGRATREECMPRIAVGTENDASIEIHYEDHGSGRPVVLIHGYPLNGNSWERQERELLASGYRVISYDRRGFGRSSQPTVGYDYDTFAADLNVLLEHLDLTDIVLVGFSMGTGEVTRYLGTYGSKRVRRAALLGTIPPFLLKSADNPEGVDGQVFEGIKAAIVKDRYAFFEDFLNNFYNVDVLGGRRISDRAWQASFNVAASASPFATYACVDTWLTDFRADLPKIDVPVLVVHGTADRILPYDSTAARRPALIADCTLVPVEGGPHNIGWTHPDEVNSALLEFIAAKVPVRT